jgi:polysaccharide export outer membrane protein
MRWEHLALAVLLSGLACRPPEDTPIPPAAPTEASFAPGDKFEILVSNEKEMSGKFQVAEDGSINFAPIGRVTVAGRTQAEVEAEIQRKLKDGYLRDPHVRVVNITETRQLSVLGLVAKPGNYPFQEGLTLVQAVSLAGGLKRLARPTRVTLTRTTANGRQTFVIDLAAIIAGKRQDVELAPGDVVFVPESPI